MASEPTPTESGILPDGAGLGGSGIGEQRIRIFTRVLSIRVDEPTAATIRQFASTFDGSITKAMRWLLEQPSVRAVIVKRMKDAG